MTAKVDKLSLSCFRGATVPVDLKFDTTKAVVLVFGENGTGKSTVADAFDFVCNGKYGSIEDYSLAGSAHKFLPALGKGALSVKVALCSGKQTWHASLRSDGVVVRSADGYPDARILRRKAILRLIDQTPKGRFEELRSFVAVPSIEKSESALRDAVNQTSKALDEAARALTQAIEALESLWSGEGKPGSSALDWAQAEAKKDAAVLQSLVKALDELESSFKTAESALSTLDAASKSEELARQKAEATEAAVKAIEAGKQDAALITLLQSAKDYIAPRGELSECPVCERGGVTSANLLAQLSDRIAQMKQLAQAVDARNKARAEWERQKAVVEKAVLACCGQIRVLARRLRATSLDELVGFENTWTELGSYIDSDEVDAESERDGRILWSTLTPVRDSLTARCNLEKRRLTLLATVKSHVKTVLEKAIQGKYLETLKNRLETAHSFVSEERKGYIDLVRSERATLTRLLPVSNQMSMRCTIVFIRGKASESSDYT
jgi:DNA repair exonuclease SbcCD ATPase subunit